MKNAKRPPRQPSFVEQAERILGLEVAGPAGRLGGYGPDGEVIYEEHPLGCPSVLVSTAGSAKATFQTNGSVAFEVKLASGMEVPVLSGHFDAVEKRETGVPSGNLWLDVGSGARRRVVSLVNPKWAGIGDGPERTRVVKLGDPDRAMWFCEFFPGFRTAVKLSLVGTPAGPALLRELCIVNDGRRTLIGRLWSFFNLHGTQRFVYNKEIWYDAGMPVGPGEVLVSASVPYSDVVQIKRVSSVAGAGLREAEATCDYSSFVGGSASVSALPEAVRLGRLLPGAGKRLNRFSIATIAAGRYELKLAPGRSAVLRQSLLYVVDEKLAARFREKSGSSSPDYPRVERAFLSAAKDLLRRTPDADAVAAVASAAAPPPPAFEIAFPSAPAATHYARSVWTGVNELYENCRAHGAKLADGIELGTRDRAQDMWPKMKEDPGRVQSDLVHAFGFMYVTNESGGWSRPLSLRDKLHGMFPRQYPSKWQDRTVEVKNDNRPYADSPLWLVNSLCRYVRETGDLTVLGAQVGTVRLVDPEHPETSGIVGAGRRQSVAEAALQILECFGRHVADSPYGLAQIMYGDWCDPVDMFGTSRVGDAATRGAGRGAGLRLTAHLFECLVETVDLLESPASRTQSPPGILARIEALKTLASALRENALRFAWEPSQPGEPAGFVSYIHELSADGSRPDYTHRGIGYTLGSMRGTDYDGLHRRELTAQAYGLMMLLTERPWLKSLSAAKAMVAELLASVDRLFGDERVGLRLFSRTIANSELSRRLVGRMGVIPAGTAENGEYHHGQMMVHRWRMSLPGEAGRAWAGFKSIVSALRDETLAGPFDMPSTSYASDPADPHFGKGMYFGLSGSTDWIVETFQEMAGVELNLGDPGKLALRIAPHLPEELGDAISFRRTIHAARPGGGYRAIPLRLEVRPEGSGPRVVAERVTINGKPAPAAEVASLDGVERVEVVVTRVRGK